MANYDADEDERTSYDHAQPYDADKVRRDNFLNAISQIESSGGKNINHPVSNAPLQAGQQAVGQYGLMPNTINEMAHRAGRSPASVAPGSPDEQVVAQQLAEHVLNKFKDPNQAAYAWHSGHNLTPEKLQERDYLNDPYVQKFQKIWSKIGSK